MKLYLLILFSIFSIITSIVLSDCSKPEKKIKIAGSTTVLPIVQAAAEIYMDNHPDISISVRGGGSSIGIKSIIEDLIDIGNASRKVNIKEKELLNKRRNDLTETAIAKDAITIIINLENPVTNLSLYQLKAIFTGQITNWSEVGGYDTEIIVVSRDVSSGSFVVFNKVILDSLKVKDNAMMLASNNAVATMVGYTPGAIGYVGLGYVNKDLNIVSIDGVLPTPETIMNNNYKLTRELFIYTSKAPKELAQDFINFVLSEEGQQIVEKQGYLRIN